MDKNKRIAFGFVLIVAFIGLIFLYWKSTNRTGTQITSDIVQKTIWKPSETQLREMSELSVKKGMAYYYEDKGVTPNNVEVKRVTYKMFDPKKRINKSTGTEEIYWPVQIRTTAVGIGSNNSKYESEMDIIAHFYENDVKKYVYDVESVDLVTH